MLLYLARRIYLKESQEEVTIRFNNEYDKDVVAIPDELVTCIISLSENKEDPSWYLVYRILDMGSNFVYGKKHFYVKMFGDEDLAREEAEVDEVVVYYEDEVTNELEELALENKTKLILFE